MIKGLNSLKIDIKRAFTSWGVIVGILGLILAGLLGVLKEIIVVFLGQMGDTLPTGYSSQIALSSLQTNVVLLVLPILAALPFTSAFVDDHKNRYIREYLPRIGVRPYLFSRVISTALLGGLVLLLGVILLYCVFALLFSPLELAPQGIEAVTGSVSTVSTEMINFNGQITFVNLAERAFLFFLSGALWSLVGGLFATITMSKYMAYASPFIFYYVLVILSQRYFTNIYVLNPQEWLNPSELWNAGIWGAVLFVSELIVLLSIAYYAIMRRRLQDA